VSEHRLEQIEIKLAYQEDATRELSDVIYRQQQLIDQLQAFCQRLEERISAASESAAETPAEDEKPPHY
jgi:SlyX protein